MESLPKLWAAAGVAFVAAVAWTTAPSSVSAQEGRGADEPPSCATLQQRANDTELEDWLADEGEVVEELIDDSEDHRVQVLVREVVSRERAPNCLVRRGYRVDAEYVYPASAIKPVAVLGAFRFVNQWNRDGHRPSLGLDSVLWHRLPDDFEKLPSTTFEWHEGGSLRGLVERTLVVSSNRDFNRLYELVGHEALNRWMWQSGLESVRLQHRMFSKRTRPEQKWSFEVAVETDGGPGNDEGRKRLQPIRRSELDLPEMPADRIEVGETHTDFVTGEYREAPMDFSPKNYMSLDDLQRMMIALYRPELSEEVSFPHLGDFRPFLTELLGRHPEPDDDQSEGDVVRRFSPMLAGVRDVLDEENVVYHNKAGRAYGFQLDNAHIANRETGREVFVTAVAYVNEDGEVNDNDYEYEQKGYPFLAGVGRSVARHLLAEQ